MADKPSKPATKRRVKNPETFRERAVKASINSDKPSKASKVKGGFSKFTQPIRAAFRKVTGLAIFKPLRKPLRLLGKIIFPTYFRNSWKELKLVTWPNWKESRQLTFAVLIFAVVFGASVALVDYGLDKVFRHILLK